MSSDGHCDLLAILLVADSSNGANLVFRWPPRPHVPVRLARPRPPDYIEYHHLVDVSYIAANALDNERLKKVVEEHGYTGKPSESLDPIYLWQPQRNGNFDYSCSAFEPESNSNQSYPAPQEEASSSNSYKAVHDLYEDLIGYQAAFLAELLSPKPALCHQKFELSVHDIAFLGHPVHAKEDDSWSFPEIYERTRGVDTVSGIDHDSPRGRTEDRRGPPGGQAQKARFHFAGESEDDAKPLTMPSGPPTPSASSSPFVPTPGGRNSVSSTPKQFLVLKSFHLVLVLDRPDPSSVASTDLDRYLDAYYQQVSFKLTAAMLYEQGRNGYVAQQVDSLIRLRESIFVGSFTLSSFIEDLTCVSRLNLDKAPQNNLRRSLTRL